MNLKCDGKNPCDRCNLRKLKCRYEPRNTRSKHSLRAELDALKEARYQKEALIEAFLTTDKGIRLIKLLQEGDTLEKILEQAGCVKTSPSSGPSSLSPANEEQDRAASDKHPCNSDSSSSALKNSFPTSLPSLEQTESTADDDLQMPYCGEGDGDEAINLADSDEAVFGTSHIIDGSVASTGEAFSTGKSK